MESLAHEVSTGIPMSTKGTVDHLYSSCERVGSSDLNSETVTDVYDHKSAVPTLFTNISRENGDCFMPSLQDGDQSPLFYNIIYSSDLPSSESMCTQLLKSSECASDVKCDKSDTSDLCRESLYAMDVIVHDIGDPLESLSAPDFVFSVKESDSLSQYHEDHKKLNETSTIAKSMEIENFLPDIFQEDNTKDASKSGQDTHMILDDNLLGKDVLELEIPATSTWPNDDSFDLSCGLVTLKTEKIEQKCATLKDSCTSYVVCTENARHPGVASSSAEINQKGSLKRERLSSDVQQISDTMVECVLDSNTDQYFSFSNDSKDEDDPIPLVHISETDYDSTVFNSLFGNDGKVQIIVSTESGKQILEFDKELASSLNIINSIEQVASENGFCANNTPNQNGSTVTLSRENAMMETPCKTDLLALVEKLSSNRRSKRKSWVCSVEGCGKVMDRERQLKVHMMTHEGEKPYKCTKDGCNWSFTTLYRLRRHKNSHNGNKDFPCDFENCNKSFTTIYNLKAHKKRHRWPYVATCPAAGCGLNFTSRRKLDLHLKIHDDVEAPYNCWTCQKKYYSANCMASHNRTHKHDENDFKCPYQGCGKKYDKICRLKQHIRFHTGERPYVCPEEGCKWSFVSASKLTRHMRKHTGERKFVCTEPGCGKSFMRPEHLKGHAIIHTGAKPFKCTHENCTAKFTAKSSLYVHMKKHCNNGTKVVYPCPVELCTKKYNTKATLKQHMQKMHRNVPNLDSNVQTVPVLTRLSKAPTNDKEPVQNSPAPKIITRIKPKIIAPKEIPLKTISQPAVTAVTSITTTISHSSQKVKEAQQPNKSIITKIKEQPNKSIITKIKEQPNKSIIAKIKEQPNKSIITKIKEQPNKSIIAKIKEQPNKSIITKIKEPITPPMCQEIQLKSCKLFQENHSGSARTDYCCNYASNFKKLWSVQNRLRLGLLNNNCIPNNLESSNQPTNQRVTMCSNDAVLASCVLYQDPTSDQLDHNQQFFSEEATNNVIYQDNVLVNSFVFSELPLTSFMCDNYNNNSNDSVVNMTFIGQNTVDEFSDSTLVLPCLE